MQVWGRIPGQPPGMLDGFVYVGKGNSKPSIWSSIGNYKFWATPVEFEAGICEPIQFSNFWLQVASA